MSGSLYTCVTKVRKNCAQMEKKLMSIYFLPQVDYIGHQVSAVAVDGTY